MEGVERVENRGDLSPDDALGLRPFPREPRAEVAVLRILHGKAIAHPRPFDLRELVEHTQRAGLATEQLGEVRLAKPRRDSIADLDADLLGKSVARRRGRKIDLAESP